MAEPERTDPFEELRIGFTAAVSHELRTPLARLLALLGQGRSDDEALRAALGLDTAAIEAELQRDITSEFASAKVRPN